MTVTEFTATYPPVGPFRPADPEDQGRLLEEQDGVVLLGPAPFPGPSGVPGERTGCHLWVIRPDGVPIVLETAPGVRPPPLASGVAKHSNLTGGSAASCGGELWADTVSADKLYVSGASGRYWAPGDRRGRERLAGAVKVFEHFGYTVVCAGWDDDVDRPARTFR